MIIYLIKLFNFEFQKCDQNSYAQKPCFLMSGHNIHDNLTTRQTIKTSCHVQGNTKKLMQLIK